MKISERHRSPTGWWIASYVERAVWNGNRDSENSRCTAWENTIIFKAKNRTSAYKKAVELGSSNNSTFSDRSGEKTGRWKFEGLTSLLPIYEPLEDGAEILWRDYSGKSLKSVRAMVKKKRNLEAFDDSGSSD